MWSLMQYIWWGYFQVCKVCQGQSYHALLRCLSRCLWISFDVFLFMYPDRSDSTPSLYLHYVAAPHLLMAINIQGTIMYHEYIQKLVLSTEYSGINYSKIIMWLKKKKTTSLIMSPTYKFSKRGFFKLEVPPLCFCRYMQTDH